MKMEKIEGTPNNFSAESSADGSKLMSLLALAAGALAIPQSSNADIVFTDLSSAPVTVGPLADPSYLLNLPGTHQFSFRNLVQHTTNGATAYIVRAGQVSATGVFVNLKTDGNFFVVPVGKSVLWSQINAVGVYRTATVGFSTTAGRHGPNAYDHQYVAFQFKDSNQGNALLNGWIELSEHFPASGGPAVTIFGYAYDTTGAAIPTGVAPEPSSASLLAFGALTLGAAGLRSWRRKRASADKA